MQDRYAGDIGDYGKFALLRAIRSQGLSVAVNWYRVEPLDSEKNSDGSYKQKDGKYLIPEDLYVCDRSLAEKLTQIANSGNNGKRSIKALEKAARQSEQPMDGKALALFCRENIVPAMQAVRDVVDPLEALVAKEYWDLPTYSEMLYSIL